MRFAPEAFRSTRVKTTGHVKAALLATNDLRSIDAATLKGNPERAVNAPYVYGSAAGREPLDRPIRREPRTLSVGWKMASSPTKMNAADLKCGVDQTLSHHLRRLDRDIFPWLDAAKDPTDHERDRASTIVADRLCSAVANPIVRNAQEQRQLKLMGDWLNARGYRKQGHPSGKPLTEMEAATYTFRMNLAVGKALKVNIPVDVVIQPKKLRKDRLPILIEAKSAGDFTNTNKRRKEEATKIHQLQAAYSETVPFVLFLCGYFGSDYLGYEAAEGIDWVWEHRIDDLVKLGL